MSRVFTFKEDPVETVAALRALASDLERLTVFQPNQDQLAHAPTLSNWSRGRRAAACLLGMVDGHPMLGSCEVLTSELYAIDPLGRWARTSSRYYRLGSSHSDLSNARKAVNEALK